MSGFFKIQRALLEGLGGVNLTYPMSQPNRELSDEAKQNGTWLKVSVEMAETNVATLGDSGDDNNPGFMQVDVNVLQNTGDGDLLNISDSICSFLHAGKALQFEEQTVKITGSSISGIRNVGGFARRSVTVRFYARTKRIT